jgi:hypothetical protein
MAYKKELADPSTLTDMLKSRFPIQLEKALTFMEANLDNIDDPKAGERAYKIFAKIFDKIVPDVASQKGESKGGSISVTMDSLIENYTKAKSQDALNNAIDAEVVDGTETESSTDD